MISLILYFASLFTVIWMAATTTRLQEHVMTYSRSAVQLFIGLLLLASYFGQHWETGNLTTKTQYKAGCGQNINASIGMNLGLVDLNIILKADSPTTGCLINEVIDYNEMFEWSWNLDNPLQKQVLAAKRLGSPKPIIWILEYFTVHEGKTTYRKLHQLAARYCQLFIWTSFISYLGAIILLQLILITGALCLGLCGILQLTANMIWFLVRNHSPLEIYVENGHIVPHVGFTYWLNFCSGIICLSLSIAIIIMKHKFKKTLYKIFGEEALNRFNEEICLSPEEKQTLNKADNIDSKPMGETDDPNLMEQEEYFDIYKK